MNDIIRENDNQLASLHRGLTITRVLKKNGILPQQHRNKCNERLVDDNYTPLDYLQAIGHTVGSF